mgnify:FL=1|jgi:hypothetical protein
MDKEYIENLISDLYVTKDVSPNQLKEPIQQTIDLLDELLMAGSIYIDEEM